MFDWRIACVAVSAVFSMGSAQAAYILDTGPGAAGSTMITLNNVGISYQNLGVSFNVSQASSITSVEAWIGNGTGNVLFELHDGANPNGSVLFSSLVTISDTTNGWRGATGLNWNVAAGDYALALIAQPGFNGGMQISPPNPAGTEWMANPLSNGWATTTFNMGWRVDAVAASVPEPSNLALLAIGLVPIGIAVRRNARRKLAMH